MWQRVRLMGRSLLAALAVGLVLLQAACIPGMFGSGPPPPMSPNDLVGVWVAPVAWHVDGVYRLVLRADGSGTISCTRLTQDQVRPSDVGTWVEAEIRRQPSSVSSTVTGVEFEPGNRGAWIRTDGQHDGWILGGLYVEGSTGAAILRVKEQPGGDPKELFVRESLFLEALKRLTPADERPR